MHSKQFQNVKSWESLKKHPSCKTIIWIQIAILVSFIIPQSSAWQVGKSPVSNDSKRFVPPPNPNSNNINSISSERQTRRRRRRRRRRRQRPNHHNSNALTSKRYRDFLSQTTPLVTQALSLWASGRLRRDDKSLASATRETLTNLGPTFVKLGQILSVREDVLGPVWAAELSKLQDEVRPFPGDDAIAAVEEAFGDRDGVNGRRERDGFLVSLEKDPVAAASLAQVHRGKWRVGTARKDTDPAIDVAVKILRPGIVDLVEADLSVLLRAGDLLSEWAPRVLSPTSRIDWVGLLEGLVDGLWEECDLEGEARRQMRFRGNMESVRGVFVPMVLAAAEGVMVSEWVEGGVPLRSLPSGDWRLRDAQRLMRDAYCRSMFVDAFFHADCHGGNLLWVPDTASHNRDDKITKDTSTSASKGRLCILDCGLMVDIDETTAESLLSLTLHLAARDWTKVVDDAIALQFLPNDMTTADKITARGIARRIVGPYLDVGGGAKGAVSAYVNSASVLFRDITAAARDLPTALPPDMVLLGRAVVQLEGVALRAFPDYRLVDDILPVATRIALRRTNSGQENVVADDIRKSLLDDLLYDESSSFDIEKLQLLLTTAGSTPSSLSSSDNGKNRTVAVEDLIDELLQADAVRDIVAQETSNLLDAMARDVLWRGTDYLMEDLPSASIFPNPLVLPPFISVRERLESLAPRINEKEQIALLRLPKTLYKLCSAAETRNNADDDDNLDSKASTSSPLLLLLRDTTLVKVTTVPGIDRAMIVILSRAVLSNDPDTRAMLDAVAQNLRERLRERLEGSGVPGVLAVGLADVVFRTPWQ